MPPPNTSPAVVDKEASGTIHRRVEGNLDLDATASAKEVDALVRDQLRTAGEMDWPLGKSRSADVRRSVCIWGSGVDQAARRG